MVAERARFLLKPQVSQLVKIVSRSSVGDDVLFRGYPARLDLDVEDCRKKEDGAKGAYGGASN